MRVYTIKAALKTFIFSRISDMFIFMAFVLTILTYNTTDLSVIFLQTPYILMHRFFISYNSIHFLTLLTLLISLAGAIKGAQFFFHV
jgi:NADH:ubiquinone oxidoreductase subunit 5 (subunit L)/multisubunit Na+/H+ antiporter MnhA subunit